MFQIEDALRYLVDKGGSDLHIKVAAPPMIRLKGSLVPIEGSESLTTDETHQAFQSICPSPELAKEFEEVGEADFSHAIPNVSRYRVNVFRQRGSTSLVCRAIPFQINSIDELGLPHVVRQLAEEPRGIILLTGTTGSGKSTTLAAMIDHINSTKAHHIMTLEDPIEFLHKDKKSIINQREIGADTHSFGRAMRRVLRQDPDVILIGEMRDEETVRTALSAAETGHLVLSTLHTMDATETINRIIDFFPPHHQSQARVMLAATLRGAISQRLVPTADGKSRVACQEILVVTGRVQDLILNPEETSKINEVMAEGDYYGMQTFDQALLRLCMAGTIREEVAFEMASSPHDFKLMLEAGGTGSASSMDRMGEDGDAPVADPAEDASAPGYSGDDQDPDQPSYADQMAEAMSDVESSVVSNGGESAPAPGGSTATVTAQPAAPAAAPPAAGPAAGAPPAAPPAAQSPQTSAPAGQAPPVAASAPTKPLEPKPAAQPPAAAPPAAAQPPAASPPAAAAQPASAPASAPATTPAAPDPAKTEEAASAPAEAAPYPPPTTGAGAAAAKADIDGDGSAPPPGI